MDSATQVSNRKFLRRRWVLWLSILVGGAMAGCGGSSPSNTGSSTAVPAAAVPASPVALPWTYRPYLVKVWFLFDDQPRWTTSVIDQLCRETSSQLGLIEPSAWRVTSEVAPAKWRVLLTHWRTTVEELPVDLYDELQGNDKLVIVRVADVGTGIHYSVNEMDVNGWSLGPTYNNSVAEMGQLSGSVPDTIAKAFRPIVRLEHSEGDIVTARVRAHGLMVRINHDEEADRDADPTLEPNKSSPCWIESGEVFEPIVRQANRQKKVELKELLKESKALDFTLLVQQDSIDRKSVV